MIEIPETVDYTPILKQILESLQHIERDTHYLAQQKAVDLGARNH